uniref:acetyl-CoA carboxylase subunit beta n=1 Tax=Calendula arvensis TaxID=99035 RepID=UPI0021822D28|nr:acetyl-CoA carboxylase subunit beta [Calendula arvensis]UVF31458.1 acetyl-CoA carboxylase subunit beta [Calendula arvensis]
MKRWWFNSMLFKKEFEHRCKLSKSKGSLGPIENASKSKDLNINDTDKSGPDSNMDLFFGVKDIRNFISDDTFLVKDSNGDSYSIYFDIENHIFEIDNDHPFCSELESSFYQNSSYLNSNGSKNINGSKSKNLHDDHYDTQYTWNNHINCCIDSYLQSQIFIDSYIVSGSGNSSKNYISSYICGKSGNSSKNKDTRRGGQTRRAMSANLDVNKKHTNFWLQCESCYELNYKKLFKSKINVCDQCGYHMKISSSHRIELSIDRGTWEPMDEDMVSADPLGFNSKGGAPYNYKNRIGSYQRKTGLTEAVQTGRGRLNGITVAIGVMDFQFMGGSMGSVVGEKITRLIEYATKEFIPLIIVCASGGARMQEGSLSLMQMAKISAALYDYQSNKKLLYVPILTSPTTGGVTASFGMLGDIIIAEPHAYIAFAGKRVIKQTLTKTVTEDSQASEYLFHKGLFDLIVPRNPLKSVLSELFQLHTFFPLNQN